MPLASVPHATFRYLAKQISKGRSSCEATEERRYRAFFGTSSIVTSSIWVRLNQADLLPKNGLPAHLLWGQLFLKIYASEEIHAGLAGVNEKTFRKWSWLFIKAISYLESRTVSSIVFSARMLVNCCFFCSNNSPSDSLGKSFSTGAHDKFMLRDCGWNRLPNMGAHPLLSIMVLT